MVTYEQAKNGRIKAVYSTDTLGGICKINLNWKRDEIKYRGESCEAFPTIEDFFEDFDSPVFGSLVEAAQYFSKSN